MNNVQFTDAEVKMLLEALAAWSFNISEQRYATNHERIVSAQCKLEEALQ